MNYPFVSILPLIDETRNELRTITKASYFSDEDMYGWAVDAARLIGNVSYESHREYLTVKKNIAILSKNFYLLNNIYLCSENGITGTVVRPTSILPSSNLNHNYIRTAVLKPADSVTRKLCTVYCNQLGSKELSYTLKLPPGIARFSFSSGIVEVDFERMKTENDCILMQDEPNAMKAVKAYIITMLLQEKYILQEIPRYIYADYQNQWDSYVADARNALKFPSQSETDYKSLQQDARYREFRYKDQ